MRGPVSYSVRASRSLRCQDPSTKVRELNLEMASGTEMKFEMKLDLESVLCR